MRELTSEEIREARTPKIRGEPKRKRKKNEGLVTDAKTDCSECKALVKSKRDDHHVHDAGNLGWPDDRNGLNDSHGLQRETLKSLFNKPCGMRLHRDILSGLDFSGYVFK